MIHTANKAKAPTETARSTGWFQSHQVTSFFIITYAITWGIGLVAILFPEQFQATLWRIELSEPGGAYRHRRADHFSDDS